MERECAASLGTDHAFGDPPACSTHIEQYEVTRDP